MAEDLQRSTQSGSVLTHAATLRDIAKVAGVSSSTVSRALRKDPRISDKTRLLVEKVALKLDYQLNPYVQIFQEHVRKGHPLPKTTIAYILSEKKYLEFELEQLIYRSLKQRAHELGFLVDVFSLDEINPEALNRILKARGIRGAILRAFKDTAVFKQVDLSNLACASIFHCQTAFPICEANVAYTKSIWLMMERIYASGYRKPALIYPVDYNFLTLRQIAAQFDFAVNEIMQGHGARMILSRPDSGQKLLQRLKTWLRRHKPDIIICHHSLRNSLPTESEFLPPPQARVYLDLHPELHQGPGLENRRDVLAVAAVDLVFEQLTHLRLGAAHVPKLCNFEPEWIGELMIKAYRE